MGKKGKRFIDRHRDVVHTFKVVSRSQRDPLVADDNAPQAVLQHTQQQQKKNEKEEEETYGVFFDDDYDYLQHLRGVKEAINWDEPDLEVYTIRKPDPQAGKKELRDKKLVLPSSAFESYIEEPIGLLNRAAPVSGPRPELDPDVVAGLDDGGGDGDDVLSTEGATCHPDDDDALPDDFVLMLNAEQPIHTLDDDDDGDGEWEEDNDSDDDDDDKEMPPLEEPYTINTNTLPSSNILSTYREHQQDKSGDSDEGNEERDFSSDFNDSEAEDEVASLDGDGVWGGDHKPVGTFRTESHFTDYSLTSSVLYRNQGLTNLDDCFEEKFIREYQEEHVGALDGEDIEGWVDESSPLFKQAVKQTKNQVMTPDQLNNTEEDDRTRIIEWIKDMQYCQTHQPHRDQDKEEIEVSDDEESEKWDCESILTTASTLYNHPRTITDPPRRKRIAVDPRTGIPIEHRVGGLTKRNLAHHDSAPNNKDDNTLDTQTLITSMSAISIRPPGETSEERRCRKKALKELRRERRIEKKLNRSAFKDEKKRQEKIMLNNKYNYKISLM
ncbi:hypothetical protein Pcinc_034959 [Petrolisthes cinctipes]|uniref:Protein LTV1 homolog n=1 Tax=Petrolisthes cinctipes TaxID=88211 RepID=A0AAE1EPY8_PETCI|nr:hypothetical protein Pcinc_034959 [Petrolisthes cinctipes]